MKIPALKMVFSIAFQAIVFAQDGAVDDASKNLNAVIQKYEEHKSYDTKQYPLGLFTKEHYGKEADFARLLRKELSKIDLGVLRETEGISLQLLDFVLKEKIDFFEMERYLNPLLSDSGFHNNLAYNVKPFITYGQAVDYINKLNAVPEFVNQHLVNLRIGLAKGVSQPRIIFKGYESTYNDHIVKSFRESYYYTPFKNLPAGLSDEQRNYLTSAAKVAIETKVIPQFKRIKKFFEEEYLPKTRKTIGILDTPNGKTFYQNRIDFYTTSTKFTADTIHDIGMAEVARIKLEMKKIISGLNFKGSFSDFFGFLRSDEQFYAKTPKELLMRARDIAKRADAQLPRFFKTLPRKPYGVAPVPDAIAPKYTGGRYIGTPANSTEPGYYWVNTYDLPSRTLYTLPSLTVHEAVPGHHLQNALNAELGDSIPNFRKQLYLSAYGEGWGLYTEFLAEEMGLYTTPYEHFGKLTYEMWRACRLVVDTGIHAKGWSREQVVGFMTANTALSLHEINTETDRYISWPGQALSYKIGELKIRALRKKAETELGGKFDVREFHEIVLGQGTVTLAILEKRIDDYIANIKNGE